MRTVDLVRTHIQLTKYFHEPTSVQYQCKYQQQFLEFSDKNSCTVLSPNKYTPNLGK